MSEIVNKFLLTGGKFTFDIHLRQAGFTYTVCRPFTRNKERMQKFKETEDSICIYQNELDKLAFNMTWLMEILKIYLEEQLLIKYCVIKHLILLKIRKIYGYQRGLASVKSLLVMVSKMKICQTKN